jgi:hypothetical protein
VTAVTAVTEKTISDPAAIAEPTGSKSGNKATKAKGKAAALDIKLESAPKRAVASKRNVKASATPNKGIEKTAMKSGSIGSTSRDGPEQLAFRDTKQVEIQPEQPASGVDASIAPQPAPPTDGIMNSGKPTIAAPVNIECDEYQESTAEVSEAGPAGTVKPVQAGALADGNQTAMESTSAPSAAPDRQTSDSLAVERSDGIGQQADQKPEKELAKRITSMETLTPQEGPKTRVVVATEALTPETADAPEETALGSSVQIPIAVVQAIPSVNWSSLDVESVESAEPAEPASPPPPTLVSASVLRTNVTQLRASFASVLATLRTSLNELQVVADNKVGLIDRERRGLLEYEKIRAKSTIWDPNVAHRLELAISQKKDIIANESAILSELLAHIGTLEGEVTELVWEDQDLGRIDKGLRGRNLDNMVSQLAWHASAKAVDTIAESLVHRTEVSEALISRQKDFAQRGNMLNDVEIVFTEQSAPGDAVTSLTLTGTSAEKRARTKSISEAVVSVAASSVVMSIR